MSNQKIIEELEQAESEALAAKAGEVIAGNVVKEAHYTGEVVGLRIALGLLRRSAEAAPNIRESDSRAKNLSTQIMKPMLPTTEKPTQAGPVSGLSVIAGSGLCFASGGIAAFSNGSQVPELQIGWPVLWARHAVAAGYNPDGFVFETPGGKIRIFKTDEDFNWEIL